MFFLNLTYLNMFLLYSGRRTRRVEVQLAIARFFFKRNYVNLRMYKNIERKYTANDTIVVSQPTELSRDATTMQQKMSLNPPNLRSISQAFDTRKKHWGIIQDYCQNF